MQDIISIQLSLISKAFVCIITYSLIYIGENREYVKDINEKWKRIIFLQANEHECRPDLFIQRKEVLCRNMGHLFSRIFWRLYASGRLIESILYMYLYTIYICVFTK